MAPTSPPWRVFDAPPADAADSARTPPDAPAGSRPAAGLAGEAMASLQHPAVAVGLALAMSGLALAVALASGVGGPAIGVDVADRDPLGEPATAGTAARDGGLLVVDVVGAVLRPGVYRLPAGSRVGDAIAAAGGYGPRVAPERVDRELNLAAVVHDGDRISVPSRDDPSAPPGTGPVAGDGTVAGPLIDLNSATEAELDTLPGIGPVTAAKITASRAEAPFRSVDELLQRKLVGQATFEAIKTLVTVR